MRKPQIKLLEIRKTFLHAVSCMEWGFHSLLSSKFLKVVTRKKCLDSPTFLNINLFYVVMTFLFLQLTFQGKMSNQVFVLAVVHICTVFLTSSSGCVRVSPLLSSDWLLLLPDRAFPSNRRAAFASACYVTEPRLSEQDNKSTFVHISPASPQNWIEGAAGEFLLHLYLFAWSKIARGHVANYANKPRCSSLQQRLPVYMCYSAAPLGATARLLLNVHFKVNFFDCQSELWVPDLFRRRWLVSSAASSWIQSCDWFLGLS